MGNILITKPFHVLANVGHLEIKSFNDATFCLPQSQVRSNFWAYMGSARNIDL